MSDCKHCHCNGYYMTDDPHIKHEYIEVECDCECHYEGFMNI
jgi:hypothetical protein